MANLTVHPDFKVETWQDSITISNKDAVILVCRKCSNTRNVFLHQIPMEQHMAPDGTLVTGTIAYPTFDHCHCADGAKPTPDEMVEKILRDVYYAIGNCEDVKEAQQMLLKLASQEEMKR